MIDYTMVSQVTNAYIFYKNDTREKVTVDKLDGIVNNIKFVAQATRFAYKETLSLLQSRHDKLDKKHCPSLEEIKASTDLLSQVDTELKREYYLEEVHESAGVHSVYEYFFDKCMFYERLLRQIESVKKYLEHTKCA